MIGVKIMSLGGYSKGDSLVGFETHKKSPHRIRRAFCVLNDRDAFLYI